MFGIFDLDPASPDPPTVRCRRFYTEADDGLLQPWSGVVYCNPPYDRLPAWTSKIVAEFKAGRVGKVVALIPCRPETRSWQMTVTSGAAIFVLEHRLRFGGRTYAPRFASAIAVWGATPAELAQLANVLPANHRMHSVYSKLVNAA